MRSANGKLSRSLALFGALNIEQAIETAQMQAFTQKKAALQEDIEALQAKLVALKASRKATDRHIAVKDLPDDQRFKQLSTHSKHFVDAIKMVAYRAETAMANFCASPSPVLMRRERFYVRSTRPRQIWCRTTRTKP